MERSSGAKEVEERKDMSRDVSMTKTPEAFCCHPLGNMKKEGILSLHPSWDVLEGECENGWEIEKGHRKRQYASVCFQC